MIFNKHNEPENEYLPFPLERRDVQRHEIGYIL